MNRRCAALLCLLVALAGPGCLQTRTGLPRETGPRRVAERGPVYRPEAELWRRVVTGNAPKVRVEAYLRTDTLPQGRLHWVYDAELELLGRVSPRGEAFRIEEGGEETRLGNHDLRSAVLTILGYADSAPVRLRPMRPPRSG